jgi:hypothetical protein
MTSSNDLRRDLREAGYSNDAIAAVWPEWWSEEADASISAITELRYTVARRLGLLPRSLFDEGEPMFIWHDQTKFKNLGTSTEEDRIILSSFGTAVGRVAIAGKLGHSPVERRSASEIRDAILQSVPFVTLDDLVSLCWGLGIPLLYLRVFPLGEKRMHAMAVHAGGRYAILLGRKSRYPAQVAYWVAHEIAHIMLNHVAESAAMLEVDDPMRTEDPDQEEHEADKYALMLLTGQEDLSIVTDRPNFNSTELALTASRVARELHIEPGILALCLGHSSHRWTQVFAALKMLHPGEVDVRHHLNELAREQLDWDELSTPNADYLLTILGMT